MKSPEFGGGFGAVTEIGFTGVKFGALPEAALGNPDCGGVSGDADGTGEGNGPDPSTVFGEGLGAGVLTVTGCIGTFDDNWIGAGAGALNTGI